MDANEPILKDEAYRIVGAAFSALRELGHGLHEKPYENALVVEFGLLTIPFEQQRRFPVIYKSVQVAEYVPDLIAFGRVIVDAKVIDRIYRSRTRPDDELSPNHRPSARPHHQFQTRQT